MLSTISREAPLRLCFERPPPSAASSTSPAWHPPVGQLPSNLQVKCVRAPKVPPPAVRRLSCRRLDRRCAICPPLRHAVVEPALLEHGIDEPDPAAHHDKKEKQQHRIRDPPLARSVHVLVFPGLFRFDHGGMLAREGAQ